MNIAAKATSFILAALLALGAATLSAPNKSSRAYLEKKDAPTEEESVQDLTKLAEDANLRVMTFNVLHEDWAYGTEEDKQLPVKGRDEKVAEFLLTYLPDVVTFQEFSEEWNKYLPDLIAEKYDFSVLRTYDGRIQSYTCIAYNKDTVKPIESGEELMPETKAYHLRSYVYTAFEKLETGEKFVVMSMHPDFDSADQKINVPQVSRGAELVLELKEKYGCPVITTGDFNTGTKTESFKKFIEISGASDSMLTATDETGVNMKYNSCRPLGEIPPEEANPIDHITFTDGLEFKFFNMVISENLLSVSDHLPIICDFKLG